MRVTLENRRESYDLIIPHISNRKDIILSYLKHQSMTASEIAEKLKADGVITFAYRGFVAPRLTELADEGRVEAKGSRFCEQTQRYETVYTTKDKWTQGRMI